MVDLPAIAYQTTPTPVGPDQPSTRLWKVSFWKLKGPSVRIPVYTHVLAGDEGLAAEKFLKTVPETERIASAGIRVEFAGYLLP